MSRKERLKVYHGIPKSVTDNNTVFYASFDKSIKPEVYNGTIVESLNSIKPSVTGNGLIGGKSNLPNFTLPKSGTVEFWIDSNNLNYTNVMDIGGFRVYINNGNMTIQLRCYPSPTNIDYFYPVTSQMHHIRFVYSNANENFEYKIYINGILKVQSSRSNWQLSLSTVPIKPSTTGILFGTTEDSYGCRAIISDLHISNIDRGDYFPNLPQDFIDGKAVIKPRMGQQQIKGDPMYSQETTDVVKIGTNINEPYITCSRTNGNWTNGDTIKIKGLSGEIISGKDSASPIVKSSSGTTITGTWSNLGANEATFTLGTNSSLTNQDLYVTYSLNIPAGNSDFTELPYSIEKVYDELGNELEEVSEIAIEDDFKRKMTGSLKECPHNSSMLWEPKLKTPVDFGLNNVTQEMYVKLSNEDGVTHNCSTLTNGKCSQQIFSFNILAMVEQKIGDIPSVDKIQWLIDNIPSITFCIRGYGSCPGRNFMDYQWWDGTNWTNSARGHTQSTLTNGYITFSSTLNISYLLKATNDGNVHFLVYTDASDGTTASTVYIDYVKLNLKLKSDTTFTTFYSENKRARENPCNPILIQKETKTVKRYLPSKECFVTEILNYGYKTNHIENFWGKVLATQNDKIVTSNGTGSYVNGINGDIDYSDKVPIPSTTSKTYEFKNELLNIYSTDNVSNCSHSVRLPIVRYWGGKQYVGVGDSNSGIDSCVTLTGDFDSKNYNLYEFFGQLRESNKELYLTVQSTKRGQGNKGLPPIGVHWTYKLPNRPLIK